MNAQCVVDTCEVGYGDADGAPTNGCECTIRFADAREECNGIDDDCDGRVDEGIDDNCEAGSVPVIRTIPWVQSQPDIPHPAVAGVPVTLAAVAVGASCPRGPIQLSVGHGRRWRFCRP